MPTNRAEPQWPPKSPHEALMGTPSGRERYRQMAERASPSPSPTKRNRIPARPASSQNLRVNDFDDDDAMDIDDEEEDEEVLRLKLQAIQAKLRLKQLQSAKAKRGPEDTAEIPSRPRSATIPSNVPTTARVTTTARSQSRTEGLRPSAITRPRSQADVQVPASPVRKAQPVQSQTSPSRVLLGIDKGLKGKDVSLKRAPSLRNTADTQSGGYLRRARTPTLEAGNSRSAQERPKTFSERLAAARSEEASRQERQARIREARSTAFELGKDEMERFKSNATEIPEVPQEPAQFSREEVLSGNNRLRRSNTVSNLRRPSQDENRSSSILSAGSSFEASEASQLKASTSTGTSGRKAPPSEVPEEEASAFEPYSSIHLSKRIIPHPVLARNLSGKKAYVIKDLLKHVKAPDFELPEIEQDIVVFGILASKSDPRAHKPVHNPRERKVAGAEAADPARGKYMVLKLVDLQWELELFLFGTGFDRYWKLTPGTLLAVLNPTVMPPPPGRADTGRFSLVINSGQDTILEVGAARDLGFCKSVKKDGDLCNSWVNRKRTEFCEFHMNAALAKHRQARQDVNAFDTGLGPGGSGGGGRGRGNKKQNGGGNGNSQYRPNSNRWGDDGDDRARENKGHWFISRASSAATMLDNECLPGQVAERAERGEALRRRLAAQEKERDLMKTLGKVGSGAGREYMELAQKKQKAAAAAAAAGKDGSDQQQQQQQDSGSAATTATAPVDARSLGLLGGKGSGQPHIHLSPVKRKRTTTLVPGGGGGSSFLSSSVTMSGAGSRVSTSRGGGAATTTTSSGTRNGRNNNNNNTSSTGRSASALGWGGNLRDKLTRMKDGANLREGSNSNGNGSNSNNTQGGAKNGGGRDADRSPVRKKTRFVTEKGIREAGRESLGGELTVTNNATATATAATPAAKARGRGRMVVMEDAADDDDDDDDELVILR
ncbi:hypothetical protein SLS62_005743 [Diatrype stigma]|uniref:Zinc finger Mcm10/DnaG-type domain-containing protein n=1 Tax=Diatrype stigma TaxID=117547 RepID=A0AAN9YS65_9PEZI